MEQIEELVKEGFELRCVTLLDGIWKNAFQHKTYAIAKAKMLPNVSGWAYVIYIYLKKGNIEKDFTFFFELKELQNKSLDGAEALKEAEKFYNTLIDKYELTGEGR